MFGRKRNIQLGAFLSLLGGVLQGVWPTLSLGVRSGLSLIKLVAGRSCHSDVPSGSLLLGIRHRYSGDGYVNGRKNDGLETRDRPLMCVGKHPTQSVESFMD